MEVADLNKSDICKYIFKNNHYLISDIFSNENIKNVIPYSLQVALTVIEKIILVWQDWKSLITISKIKMHKDKMSFKLSDIDISSIYRVDQSNNGRPRHVISFYITYGKI